ncbi:alpha/beta-hydrolase [Melanomma pulvis-pyrius CBS 109.77]|uniref:Alpha/beta-hydrolase n=1 Tax=Melanomma pulvis-pyrius CBS 109.77 TaxID=1314802 RepID=A0A6A6XVE3_9PLEO|nr:alpha/beta-hydrolase [Melanomma pulvis-pyrius CBS 109.77]
MDPKPTIVICPGAWAAKQFFDPVMSAFEAKGYPTVWDISSYPEHDPASFPPENLDAKHLRERVLTPLVEQGKDVVLFMHSYGGIYGPSAVEGLSKKERTSNGLKGGLIALLWTAAFVARKGTSAMAAMGIDPNNLPEWIDHDETTNWVVIRKTHAKAMLFHDLPDEEADRLAEALPQQPFSCFALPVLYDPYDDPNFQDSFGYIFTDADRIIPYELQQKYVQIGGIKKTMVLEGSSHSPHLEQPVQLVGNLVGLLEELTSGTK